MFSDQIHIIVFCRFKSPIRELLANRPTSMWICPVINLGFKPLANQNCFVSELRLGVKV